MYEGSMRKVYQREKSSSLGTRAAGMRCGVRLLDYTRQSAHVHVAAAASWELLPANLSFISPTTALNKNRVKK